jgi:hypothetical protein
MDVTWLKRITFIGKKEEFIASPFEDLRHNEPFFIA